MSEESIWARREQLSSSHCRTGFLKFTGYVRAAASVRVISASKHRYPP